MKKIILFILTLLFLSGCIIPTSSVFIDKSDNLASSDPLMKRVDQIFHQFNETGSYPGLLINYPYDGSVFPPEIAAPKIHWQDDNPDSSEWLVEISFSGSSQVLYALAKKREWAPKKETWNKIKSLSTNAKASLTILGLSKSDKNKVVSKNRIDFYTSSDPVDANIFYRQVPLPFPKNFKKVKWRFGDISSYEKPKVVMENIEICTSCHAFSRDGKQFSMEMNYGNDSGAQFIADIDKEVVLTKKNFFSWSDFPRDGIIPPTRGLFGRMSPTAQYFAATVNEISLALLTNEDKFSQVFFPTYGVLAYYSTDQNEIKLLPGADDYNFVQANPNWSPDEKYIVFARSKAKNEVHDDIFDVSPKRKEAGIHELNKKYNIQFDLYKIPFNKGEGGTPKPLAGASNNGMSNYFARYSPDGKWIVFTKSKTGIMLQPDSRLFIIPAEGGTAREMTCNRSLFNSWHSWSPNGKWLLFTSKVNTPYTEVFLTHIDDQGNDSPPVLLSRFSESGFAVNVPEFVNIKYEALDKIIVQ